MGTFPVYVLSLTMVWKHLARCINWLSRVFKLDNSLGSGSVYSRISIIRISIMQTLDYPNAPPNFLKVIFRNFKVKQPNKQSLSCMPATEYKDNAIISFIISLLEVFQQLYVMYKMKRFSYTRGRGICITKRLKED